MDVLEEWRTKLNGHRESLASGLPEISKPVTELVLQSQQIWDAMGRRKSIVPAEPVVPNERHWAVTCGYGLFYLCWEIQGSWPASDHIILDRVAWRTDSCYLGHADVPPGNQLGKTSLSHSLLMETSKCTTDFSDC
jgi:hypothetical protein